MLYTLIIIFVVGLLYAYYVEPNFLKLVIVEIQIDDLPDSFDGYRIALLADFHYPRWVSQDFVRKSIILANEFAPDLMVLAGDFCDKHRTQQSIVPPLAGLFDHAFAADGVVGVLGNHDHWLDADQIRMELSHTPVRLIENQAFCVERNGELLAVGGVGDLWEGVVNLQTAFLGVSAAIPRILVSHNPDVAEIIPSTRVDLQLSGHTHGGQVRIPFGPAPKVPSKYGNKYRAGLVSGPHYQVYVTRGVCSAHHFRFCCPPEVTGIVLRKR